MAAYTTIDDPGLHMKVKLYTGTGSSNAITGIGFQPDLIWTATRNEAEIHPMNDSVNGINNYLRSNAHDTLETAGSNITAQGSDGYTVGTENRFNQSSNSFVSWNWKANGSGSANTTGSEDSTVSANTTSGFSIVKYTNPSSGSPFTVGHSIGASPKLVIIKNLSTSQTWGVWHIGIATGQYLRLDDTAAAASANLVTATSSTTFSTYQDHHSTGNELIAYCWAPIQGFSKFGKYTGNGSATDGTYIHLGFRAAWFMMKRTTSGYSWAIKDNKRSTYNEVTTELYADSNDADTAGGALDFLSNGIKLKNSSGTWNGSGVSYIYMAFAEAPFVNSNGVPCNAR